MITHTLGTNGTYLRMCKVFIVPYTLVRSLLLCCGEECNFYLYSVLPAHRSPCFAFRSSRPRFWHTKPSPSPTSNFQTLFSASQYIYTYSITLPSIQDSSILYDPIARDIIRLIRTPGKYTHASSDSIGDPALPTGHTRYLAMQNFLSC